MNRRYITLPMVLLKMEARAEAIRAGRARQNPAN